jgi:aspartyl-tRNA synthetase
VRLSGWVHRKRDHGGLVFVDLRDSFGLTQLVFHAGSQQLAAAEALRLESVITVSGRVVAREPAAINPRLETGEVEVEVSELAVQSTAEPLPLQTCGARRCTATSCCGRGSSPRSAGA